MSLNIYNFDEGFVFTDLVKRKIMIFFKYRKSYILKKQL